MAWMLSAHCAEPWSFVVEPYLMLPNMEGKVGIGEQPPASVSEDPSDIFGNLQWGAMLYLEARNDLWAFSSDLLYMDLKVKEDVGDPPIAEISVNPEQLAWELAAMRRISPGIDLGVSLIYNEITATVNLTPTGGSGAQARMKEDWIDPSVVMRGRFPLNDKWALAARANVGGFGMGSDLFWQLQAHATYSFSERMNMSVGYRYISVDYDEGSGPDRFIYDMDTFGPVFRFAWVL